MAAAVLVARVQTALMVVQARITRPRLAVMLAQVAAAAAQLIRRGPRQVPEGCMVAAARARVMARPTLAARVPKV